MAALRLGGPISLGTLLEYGIIGMTKFVSLNGSLQRRDLAGHGVSLRHAPKAFDRGDQFSIATSSCFYFRALRVW